MVAQSSCEAEYIAAANAACQAYIVDHSSTDSDARVSAKCANAEGRQQACHCFVSGAPWSKKALK